MGGIGVAVSVSVSISLASESLFFFCSGVWLELWNLMGLEGEEMVALFRLAWGVELVLLESGKSVDPSAGLCLMLALSVEVSWTSSVVECGLSWVGLGFIGDGFVAPLVASWVLERVLWGLLFLLA